MKDLSLKDVAILFENTLEEDVLLQGVSVDSRRVQKGDLFICLEGERVDGHRFAQSAIDQGAVALLVNRLLDVSVPQIVVEDTEKALFDLAKWYRLQMDAVFIGITGSNGKTSTKDILAAVLSQKASTYATHKNQNTPIGTCLNVLSMNPEDAYGVFELGLDESGDIEKMREIVQPEYVILTSLAPAHMANFDSVDEIAREKMLIAEGLPSNHVFFQGDFDLYFDGLEGCVSFGQNKRNNHRFSNVEIFTDRTCFELDGESYETNLVGAHQASNASGAILLLEKLGIDQKHIKHGLSHVSLTEMRMQKMIYGQMHVLFDAYKSNLDSLKYALDYFSIYAKNEKKYAILSEMVELGPLEKKTHIQSVAYLDEIGFEKVYLIGAAFEKIQEHLDPKRYVFAKSIEELQDITQQLSQKDIYLFVKGSRSYALERIFTERDR